MNAFFMSTNASGFSMDIMLARGPPVICSSPASMVASPECVCIACTADNRADVGKCAHFLANNIVLHEEAMVNLTHTMAVGGSWWKVVARNNVPVACLWHACLLTLKLYVAIIAQAFLQK